MMRCTCVKSKGGNRICPRNSLIAAYTLVALFLGLLYCGGGSAPEGTAQKAFELRMSGKADDAKTLLENAISENPQDAAAHYELSRTLLHMGLGKGREIFNYIEQAKNSIDKAVESDPENVIYRFFACRMGFMQAYMSLQGDEAAAREKVSELNDLCESVLELSPGYHEARLFLVEINGALPGNLGADSSKAEMHAKQLEAADPVLGAKARAILLPEETDLVEYWQKIVDGNPGNSDALDELGRTCLRSGKTEDGIKYLEDVFSADPAKNIVLLDIARYHIMRGMRDAEMRDKLAPLVEEALNRYLATGPVQPLKAYATGLKSRIKYETNEEEADRLSEEAVTLDPYYSRAFGVPTLDLFVPVGEESHNHRYLFQPY
ncbi:MAG: tetratricopeptide repeat protein [Candidatus Zixiibacteriota bacterium]|nr:MAG: tetratricopeptide repeat protein [candidate division Zixibacteria bacterium]